MKNSFIIPIARCIRLAIAPPSSSQKSKQMYYNFSVYIPLTLASPQLPQASPQLPQASPQLPQSFTHQ
ncbi:hypothetical protein AM1_4871 [Acaryochloris marina MBIC11017]|uniref:Uncharacterized protein n=1 Tax=Acaryochloris marina (strain MBIC 11017) TaxID=329726 RepID=B0C3K8_ACAM1|nr:hypothetical protein AM1_4871 [Acaryochloris marina MBIC11017]